MTFTINYYGYSAEEFVSEFSTVEGNLDSAIGEAEEIIEDMKNDGFQITVEITDIDGEIHWTNN